MSEQHQYPTREQIAEAIRNSDWDSLGNWHAEPERIKDDYRKNADAVLALFPQPTPSAEPMRTAQGDDPERLIEFAERLLGARLDPWQVRLCRRVFGGNVGRITTRPQRTPAADRTPCTAETHSWDHFRSTQVDSYWIRCTEVGEHREHSDSNTGLTWFDPSTIRDVTPPESPNAI